MNKRVVINVLFVFCLVGAKTYSASGYGARQKSALDYTDSAVNGMSNGSAVHGNMTRADYGAQTSDAVVMSGSFAEKSYFFGDLFSRARPTYTELGMTTKGKTADFDLMLSPSSPVQVVNFQDTAGKSRAFLFVLLGRETQLSGWPYELGAEFQRYENNGARSCLFIFEKSSDTKYGSQVMWVPVGVMTATAGVMEFVSTIDAYISNAYINKKNNLTIVYKDVPGVRGAKMVGKKVIEYGVGSFKEVQQR
jgi:hypothetical protein